MNRSPVCLRPRHDVGESPDTAHGERRDGLGEVVALSELVDPCTAHTQYVGEFLASDELLHSASIDTCLVFVQQFALDTCVVDTCLVH